MEVPDDDGDEAPVAGDHSVEDVLPVRFVGDGGTIGLRNSCPEFEQTALVSETYREDGSGQVLVRHGVQRQDGFAGPIELVRHHGGRKLDLFSGLEEFSDCKRRSALR
jgi:hypothetical protein